MNINMIDRYGESWIEDLERSRPNLERIFENCRRAQIKEQMSFGSRASQNLLDFTYPQQLFEIILSKAEWKNVFRSIFKQDEPYWRVRGQLLSKIRNPLAHNRDESLYEHERQIAEGYCKEILSVLKA